MGTLLMVWFNYAIWALAIFLAGSWTFGLVVSPRNRIGSTIVTVILWWLLLVTSFSGDLPAWHLLYAFPAALLLPALFLLRHR